MNEFRTREKKTVFAQQQWKKKKEKNSEASISHVRMIFETFDSIWNRGKNWIYKIKCGFHWTILCGSKMCFFLHSFWNWCPDWFCIISSFSSRLYCSLSQWNAAAEMCVRVCVCCSDCNANRWNANARPICKLKILHIAMHRILLWTWTWTQPSNTLNKRVNYTGNGKIQAVKRFKCTFPMQKYTVNAGHCDLHRQVCNFLLFVIFDLSVIALLVFFPLPLLLLLLLNFSSSKAEVWFIT